MKRVFVFVCILGVLNGLAQKTANPDVYAKLITPEDLRQRLSIVASAEMEGRRTATEGQRRAAFYIESQFKAMGLQPGNSGNYQLFYNVYQDSLVNATLDINGKDFELGKDFTINPLNNTGPLRFKEVVFLDTTTAGSLNADIAGKLIMVIGNPPTRGDRTGNLFLASLQRRGVAAVLTVSKGNAFAVYRNGRQQMDTSVSFKRMQLFTVSERVAKAIMDSDYDNAGTLNMSKTYRVDVSLNVKKAITIATASDVIGVLPGTDLKDQYLVVSAHYDHLGMNNGAIYYGADDDGSGTVSMLQMAQAFAKAKADGKGPRRSIVFLANSGEEEGLWGSDYYTSHPTFPLEKTTADLNIDMIGRTDSSRKVGDSLNYVYVVGDDKLSTDLRTISEAMNKKYVNMELDYKFNDPNDRNRIYFRSDHYNFAKHGVPIIFYYDGMLGADYHKPTDTPDKINYNLLAKRAQLVFYTAWEMANRNDMLKRDIALPIPTRRRM